MAAPVFEKSKVVVFSSLSESEKDKYLDFLVDNNVQFFKTRDGNYAANIRLCTAEVAGAGASEEKSGPSGARNGGRWRRGSRSSHDSASHRRGGPGGGAGRGLGAAPPGAPKFNASAYPKFCSLIAPREGLTPKRKTQTWLMRLLEELYDVRYAKDTADIHGDADDGVSHDATTDFPVFVVEFFSKRYGLKAIVEQMCWDLLYNVQLLRKESLEVQIFSRFLEEFYDADDLLFFLHVRSVVQKELGINFKSRWSELTRVPERQPRTTFLSHRECQLVSRVVFGSEADPLYKAFMNVVERHVVGQRSGKKDTRRIEVMQFLHLALSEYHEMSPADGGGAPGGGVGDPGSPTAGAGGPGGVTSREEQERLFREAEAMYNDSVRRAVGGGLDEYGAGAGAMGADEGSRDDRVRAMEASLASRVGGGASGDFMVSTPASAASGAGAGGPGTPGAGMGAAAGTPASASGGGGGMAVPNREMLQLLGQAMHNANEAYLTRVMATGRTLPDALFEQIRNEVRAELESKVDGVLAAVINKTGSGDAAAVAADPLASLFRDVLSGGGGRGVTMAEFATAVVESNEVRQDIEPLVALLFTYATSRIEEKKAEKSDK